LKLRVLTFLVTVVLLGATGSAARAADALVSTASPAGSTPRNHQNEPAVAIDQSRPSVLAAGWNDFVDQQPCPRDAAQTGTCLNEINGSGLSGVGFSFDQGRTWVQPTYTGWTTATCTDPDVECTGSEGPINTLPWYYESGLVSEGDPAVAFGPIRGANGRFSWANGSRLYYANLVGRWNPAGSDITFPGEIFHGLLGLAVSRADNVSAGNVQSKSTWQRPVVINAHAGQSAFEDKEQIWADNAASSPHFGNVYICNAEFRSLGHHNPGTTPAPLKVYTSADGGDSWAVKQVTPAGAPGQNNPTEWGYSGCTIRTDSDGVVYMFAERFQNPDVVGLPTHGTLVMWKSFDAGRHWTKQNLLRRTTDPCYFIDPVYGRCVLDGFAGARTDLAGAPSVDIANGAPTGDDATDEIVMSYIDSVTLNDSRVRFMYSTDRGGTWNGPQDVNLPGDRGMYAAPAIAPNGSSAYVVYEADQAPWRGADMTAPRPYHGVFLRTTLASNGAPSGWSTFYDGPSGDLRASYPGHDIYQERVGDYVYAAASRTYGTGVWSDLRRAAVCNAVQDYRARSLAAGQLALPAPWPPGDCPSTFGNVDIWAATTG
jgi:hypothetical protein